MKRERKRLLFCHLFGIGAFNFADYILTLDFLEKGFTEANPIMASMVGTYQFPMVKLVLVPLLLIFLWQHKEKIGNLIVSLTWIPFLGYLSLMVYYRFLIVTFT